MKTKEFSYTLHQGPIVEIEVRSPATLVDDAVKPRSKRIRMLLDTGARSTHIRHSVAEILALKEQTPVVGSTIDGQELSLKTYIADLLWTEHQIMFSGPYVVRVQKQKF